MGHDAGRRDYVDVMPDLPADNEQQPQRSFGWTSSRAAHVYMIQHAPIDRLLEYLRLEPLPDAPPADLGDDD